MTLSERIIEYRAREDISQEKFAARVGVGRSTIIKAENGRRISRLNEAKINRVLGGGDTVGKEKRVY